MSKARARMLDYAERLTQLHFDARDRGLQLWSALCREDGSVGPIHEAILKDALEVTTLRELLEKGAPRERVFERALELGELTSEALSTYIEAIHKLQEARHG